MEYNDKNDNSNEIYIFTKRQKKSYASIELCITKEWSTRFGDIKILY